MKFIPAGPPRYAHQKQALRRMIEAKGIYALLMEPGVGKTAPTLDYLSILALKARPDARGLREIRVLVLSPKAAVDNWVIQSEKYVHPDVNVWAEALGGSLLQKSATLANRGPSATVPRTLERKKDAEPASKQGLNLDRAQLTYFRGAVDPQGLAEFPTDGPRLVLMSTNYEMFASRASHNSRTKADVILAAVKKFQPDVIVADEMHKLKGPTSNTSRLVARVGEHAPRRLGLTGTVMPHSPMDVFAQWRFLHPTAFGALGADGQRKRTTFQHFQSRFAELGGFRGREVIGFKNLDVLQNIMAKNSIVVRKEDALDLPNAVDSIVSFALSDKEQRVYDEMKRDLVATLADGSQIASPNRLTQIMRLRQITAGHLPDAVGDAQEVGTSKINTIASIANDTLDDENRLVVFGVFRHEMEALHRALDVPGTTVLRIDGSTPDAERLALRRRFGSDEPTRLVLLAQIKTVSLSVNELITASNAIFASLSQQRDDLIQGRDRLNRIGQTRKMTFWFPLARGTIDEVIYRSHEARTDLETAVLKHIQGVDEIPHATFANE